MFKLGVKFYLSQSGNRVQIWEQDDSLPAQQKIATDETRGFSIISQMRPELRGEVLFIRGGARHADWEIARTRWKSVKVCEACMNLIDGVNDNDSKVWIREV